MNIKSLYIYLTWNCNLSCNHCWVNSCPEENQQYIDQSYIVDCITQLSKNGLRYIKFSGGEPFCERDRLYNILEKCSELGLSSGIETNGTLLTSYDLKTLKTLNCNRIAIFLDGVNEIEYGLTRNNTDMFKIVVEKINEFYHADYDISVTYSIDKRNMLFIDDMVSFLKRFPGITLKINPIMRYGRQASIEDETPFLIEIQEYINLVKKYNYTEIDGVKCVISSPLCLNIIKGLTKKVEIQAACDPLSILSVFPDGLVCLCGQCKHTDKFAFGHLRDDSIKNILSSKSYIDFEDMINSSISGACSSCKLFKMCKGHCRLLASFGKRRENESNPICEYMKKNNMFYF